MRKILAIASALWLALAPAAIASQATLVTPSAPLPMTALAAFLNAAFLSIGSQNSGASAPANGPSAAPFAGENWCNTTATLWVCNLYDGTNWNQYGTLDTAGHRFTPFMGANLVSGGLPYGASATTIGWTAAGGADQFLQGPTPGWASLPNCTGALTYSTGTHTVGCNTTAGTGTVTSVGPNTGITTSPNPIVATGTVAVDQTFSPTWTGTHIHSGNVYFGSGRPWVDVRSGSNSCAAAAGDGVTNDQAAIQCQINFMNSTYGGGIVYFPPGSFLVSSTVTVKGGVILQGTGANDSSIKITTDIIAIAFDATSAFAGMDRLTVFGNQSSAATQNLVTIANGVVVNLSDCELNGGLWSLQTNGVDGNVSNCVFFGWGTLGGGITSQGGNTYYNAKIDQGATATKAAFQQGVAYNGGTVENRIINSDMSCSPMCTDSLIVADTNNLTFMTVVSTDLSSPISITGAKSSFFGQDNFGNGTFAGVGSITIAGSNGVNGLVSPSGGTYSCAGNLNIACTNGARSQSTPGNPSGTTSTSGVMAGLAGSFTPVSDGTMLLMINGSAANSTLGDGCNFTMRYGTGSAPANAAAPTGTIAGNTNGQSMISATANQLVPVAMQGYVTGLTIGTAYWLDLDEGARTGGTCSIFNVTVVAIEE